jgi:choline dehydrogenase-like flavoprotein
VELLTGTVPEDTDYLVIGSGFGGSVMAATLAGPGRRVCLLERGNAYPPGSFPRSPDGMAKNFWDPSGGLYGMFNVWSFEHVDAIVSSGLGGGSLIYANVLLELKAVRSREPHGLHRGQLHPGRRPQHYVGPRRKGEAAHYVRPSVRSICGLACTVVDSAARSGRPSFMHAL